MNSNNNNNNNDINAFIRSILNLRNIEDYDSNSDSDLESISDLNSESESDIESDTENSEQDTNENVDINVVINRIDIRINEIENEIQNIHDTIERVYPNDNINDEEIREYVNNMMKDGYDNLYNATEESIRHIERSFLFNCHLDNDIDKIKRTISSSFTYRRDITNKDVLYGIMNYSLFGNNIVFNQNYNEIDGILRQILFDKRKRHLQFEQLFRINQLNMQDVKMIMSEEEYENLPKSNYETYSKREDILDLDKCMICLDQFSNSDTIDIMPCKHIFHCECNKPWLTEHSYKCSYCKTPGCNNPVPNQEINNNLNI